MPSVRPSDFFDLSSDDARNLFAALHAVWDVIPSISRLVESLVGDKRTIDGDVMPGAFINEGPVYVAKGAVVESGACILGRAFIGPGAVVRSGAYIRHDVIMLNDSLLGHASEAKNAIFLSGAKAPHFAYVGGNRVNLGAGTRLSNARIDREHASITGRPTIRVEIEGHLVDTGLQKLGAILGDDVEVGCNAVLSPGCLVGPRTLVYPGVVVPKGLHPSDAIIKLRQQQQVVRRASPGERSVDGTL
jgi:NDP-sugar pyrophosphorylase family protein